MIGRDLLKERFPGEHFEVFFARRDPTAGSSGGLHGIREQELVDRCVEALNRAFAFLLGPSLRLPVPRKRVPVYIFEIALVFPEGGSPFTFEDRDGDPYIALPARIDAPTRREEFDHMMAAAAHETLHAVAWQLHSPRSVNAAAWRWFHEGCAVWTETQVIPEIVEYLRFGMDWCDRPDVPLDDDRALYQSGFFVRYLVARFGPELIGDMWRHSSSANDTPLDVLHRLRPAASEGLLREYFRDAFFIADPESPAHSPDLVERYKSRAVEPAIRLSFGDLATLTGTLDHLSCRYYLVMSPCEPLCRTQECRPPLHVDVIGMTSDDRRTQDPALANRWMVVVSNTSLTKSDDGRHYRIELTAGAHVGPVHGVETIP